MKKMITEYICDKCDTTIEEYSQVYLKGDLYWGTEPSIHLCKKCTALFNEWLKEKPQ